MAGHGRSAEAGKLGDGDLELRLAECVSRRKPARAHDESDVVIGSAGALTNRVGGLLGTFVGRNV